MARGKFASDEAATTEETVPSTSTNETEENEEVEVEVEAEAEAKDLLTDWNAEEEYEPPLCAPKGKYLANISNLEIRRSVPVITITAVAEGNAGICTDGKTPVDGIEFAFNIWLPKPTDATTRTKSGRQTKRAWKIGKIQKAAKESGIPEINSLEALQKAIDSGKYIGVKAIIDVDVKKPDAFNDEFSNEVTSIKLVAR